MRHKIFCKKRTSIFLMLILALSLIPSSVFAASYTKGDNTTDKIVAKAARECYEYLADTIQGDLVKKYLNNNASSSAPMFKDQNNSNQGSVLLPNTAFNDNGNAKQLSCNDFLFGGNGWDGIVSKSTDAASFLQQLKYQKEATQSIKKCFKLKLSYNSKDYESNDICLKIGRNDQNQYIITAPEYMSLPNCNGAGGDDQLKVFYNSENFMISQEVVGTGKCEVALTGTYFTSNSVGVSFPHYQDIREDSADAAFEKAKELWLGEFRDALEMGDTETLSIYNVTYYKAIDSSDSDSNSDVNDLDKYKKGDAGEFAQGITGHSGMESLSPNEMFDIYAGYLLDSSRVTISCISEDTSSPDVWKEVTAFKDGDSGKKCYVSEKTPTKYVGDSDVSNKGDYKLNKSDLSLDDIVSRINAINHSKVDVNAYTPASSSGIKPDDGDGQTATTCHGATGAVGWFICPILELAADTAVTVYNSFIEPSLKTDPELFKTDGYNGTYQAWQTFRDVANIAFAIFLLFIIFSQVTGIGIDNYGIKKSLPKLIVAVILVNISFYICQFLIDVSNILGNSLYGLLNGIGDKIAIPDLGLGGSISYGTSIAFTIFTAIGGIAAAAVFWTAVKGALLAVIPTLISALAGILFFFFLLAMRQTIVVLLVAISPLAFVCYALPNTKNLFDRWSQLLRGMLLLYPICSLMIAGGRLVSKIILASGGARGGSSLFFILVAMIAEIGPLFMIPSLTRSAFRATGQLGTALNGLRGRMTGGARNITRNNKALQRAVARNQRNRANSSAARRRVNRYNASASKPANDRNLRDFWNLRRGNQERVAEINQASLKAEEEQRRINQMSNAQQVLGMGRAARTQQEAQEGRNEAWANATDDQIEIALRASREESKVNTEKQMINSANYADAEFGRAVIRQAETESDSAKERQTLWNRDGYREGKENANTAALKSELETTRLWTHEDYIKGKLAESDLSREGDEKRTKLYADNDYVVSRQNAQKAVISNEVTKMYSDQFSRMSMPDVMDKLNESIHNGNKEQFTAAASSLVQIGQADKVREVITGKTKDESGNLKYPDVSREFGNLVSSNTEFRNQAAQILGSSGNFMFQEYAKHLGQKRDKAVSFSDWTADTANGLAASIRAKGIDRMDKDDFGYLTDHPDVLVAAGAENISKVAASTTDAATIAKLASAIEKLGDADRKAVIAATSADRAGNMNQAIRDALAGAKPAEKDASGTVIRAEVKADNTLWQNQIGDAIRTNPQIAARFTAEQQKQYIKPAPTQTHGPASRYGGTDSEDFSADGGI